MSIDPAGRIRPKAPSRLGLTERRRSAAAKSKAVDSLQRFVRLEQWNGLVAGDVVRVVGHASRGRHWRFRAHVTNTSNGASWVEVALVEGSPPSRRPASVPQGEEGTEPRVEKIRSFDPGVVEARWSRLGRRRSRERSVDEERLEPSGPPSVLPDRTVGPRGDPSLATVRVIRSESERSEQPALF